MLIKFLCGAGRTGGSIMRLEEVREIVNRLESEFDSHKFIREFIFACTRSYGNLLVKHGNVTTAHAEIANFLRNHAEELSIEKIGEDKISKDIFGNDVPNANWRKK